MENITMWYEVHEIFEGRVCAETFTPSGYSGLCKKGHPVYGLREAREHVKELKLKSPEKDYVVVKVVETKQIVLL